MDTNSTTNDLTIIYLTASEHPSHWEDFHRRHLLEAVGDYPIITVSRKPVNNTMEVNGQLVTVAKLSDRLILDIEPQSHRNMYRQLLKACKLATTPYIATAESDTLYPKEHFTFFRPKLDEVAYDMSRWTLFTWKPDLFSLRYRISNCTLLAPREYYIEALEERYGDNATCRQDIIGEVGRHLHEETLGITPRKSVNVWCPMSTVQINHENGTNYREAHHPKQKRMGEVKAYEIPQWGRAVELAKEYR